MERIFRQMLFSPSVEPSISKGISIFESLLNMSLPSALPNYTLIGAAF
jgi:hypothetical protein